ncbi:MAG: PLDc N-terminal domain-containing protein [Coriobacteriia bacterium]|nr:PLDc N-terminal domain-containing protein [Coriobacteriia bacterium]
MEAMLRAMPLFLPLAIVQVGLLVVALRMIFAQKYFPVGNQMLWIFIVVLFSFFGPILYFIFGREQSTR